LDDWSARRWGAWVAVTSLLATIACTWPLALHFSSAVPLGTETAATIPVFDVWTLWWSADRFVHTYAGLWDAPIFHPILGAFAFSEPMLLPGAVASPLFALHAPPALAHNFILVAALCTNGMLSCRCARALGVERLPALLAGVLMVAMPFLAKMQGELPVLLIGGTLATLDGAVRFGRDGRTLHAGIAGVGLVAQALTSLQLSLFSFLFAAAAGLVALAQRRFDRGSALRLGGTALVTALVVYFIVREPMRIHQQLGFHRDAELTQSLSANVGDFFSRPQGALIPFPPSEDVAAFTEGLFPGLVLFVLAAYGVIRPTDAARRPWRWYFVGACIAAFLLSLGLNFSVFGWVPFQALRSLPGFGEVRSVFRCAVFLQMHLAVLAGLGLSAIWRRYAEAPRSAGGEARGTSRARGATLAVGLLGALENLSVPARLLPLPAPRADWTRYLAAQPPDTVLAHVPFPSGRDVEDLAPEAWRMYAQIDHQRSLVNGYSSYFPALHREFMFAMGSQFPHPMLACALRRVFHADLLVVDSAWLSLHSADFAQLGPILHPEYADSAVAIYRLQPSEEQCPPMRIDIGAQRP
jgi:hypothetical protein